jgi:hypothetical protein
MSEPEKYFLPPSGKYFKNYSLVLAWKFTFKANSFLGNILDIEEVQKLFARAHSFGQFKKQALLKARTQSPCFSYPGLV